MVDKIVKVIESCVTVDQLFLTKEWIQKLEKIHNMPSNPKIINAFGDKWSDLLR